MRFRKLSYRLPDYLACYLINGDPSGLTDSEQAEIDAFLKKERITIIDKSEESAFYHSNDLNNLGADCSQYTARRIPRNNTIDKIITEVSTKSLTYSIDYKHKKITYHEKVPIQLHRRKPANR